MITMEISFQVNAVNFIENENAKFPNSEPYRMDRTNVENFKKIIQWKKESK